MNSEVYPDIPAYGNLASVGGTIHFRQIFMKVCLRA